MKKILKIKPLLAIFFLSLCLNTFGQNIYTGEIINMPNPCETDPCLPGLVFGLETSSKSYVLTINSNWIWADNKLIVEDIEYFIDDEVEITGITTIKQDIYSKEYTELEIETIKKLGANIESLSFYNNKIYYDPATQVIVIDKTLQLQSFTLELYDIHGKVILRKTGTDNTISIANLPTGVYLYRLLQSNQAVYSGKILKNN